MTTETTTTVVAADDNAPALLTEVHALAMPDMVLVGRSASAALRMAGSFTVTCQDDYEMAADELKAVKAKIVTLEAKRESVAGPLYKAWKALNTLFKAPMDALKQAETMIKTAMLDYTEAQERIAAEARRAADLVAANERRRVEAEARAIEQKALVERQRLAKVEADRVAEAQAEQDRLASLAIAAAAAGDEEAAAEAEKLANEAFERDEVAARQAREQSDEVEQAAQSKQASLQLVAAVSSAPIAEINRPKAAGVSIAKTVDYEVADKLALVKHIAQNPDLISLLTVDTIKLRAYVRGLGMNTKLPGVKVFEKRSMSARAA